MLEELGRYVNRGGSQEGPNCGARNELVEHILFECTSYDSRTQILVDNLKQVLLLDAFEAFLRCNFFNKAVSPLREKQGTSMLVNNECSLGKTK